MAVLRREYGDYLSYVDHQKKKLDVKIDKYTKRWPKRVKAMKKRIKSFSEYVKGPVLCLGARLGEEVVAFLDQNVEVRGIDLNPGPDNMFVKKGDFHDIPFGKKFNTVYSNCMDHCYDFEKIVSEIDRVLLPGGRVVFEIDHLYENNRNRRVVNEDSYESVIWEKIDDVKKSFSPLKLLKHYRSPAYDKFEVTIWSF